MSRDELGKDRAPGPFRLLRRCDEVEPRLGRLYESWNETTGRPALTLFPNESVQWQPVAPLRGWLWFDPPNAVTLELEPQPDAGQAMDWVNLITLLGLAGQRVEDSMPRKGHLAGKDLPRGAPRAPDARNWPGARAGWAVASLAALGLVFWCGRTVGPSAPEAAPPVLTNAPELAKFQDTKPVIPSYPLPSRPFADQAVPPCETRKGAVEIKGGCWLELAKKPPCFDTQAEYQDKCYLPVAKKEKLPQAVEP